MTAKQAQFQVGERVVVDSDSAREGLVLWRALPRPAARWVYVVEMARQAASYGEERLTSTGRRESSEALLGRHPELSYDIVMEPDPPEWVEGSFRAPGHPWGTLVVKKDATLSDVEIRHFKWPNGVMGLDIRVPRAMTLTKERVKKLLAQALGEPDWSEVRGPDSMLLRPD